MRPQSIGFRKTTSTQEPLDAALERFRVSFKIDCFVVVWDLLPPWDRNQKTCRWNETLAFYEGLSLSQTLDEQFRTYAERRFEELRKRRRPNERTVVPQLEPGGIVAVCVDPLFESIFMNESAMRRSLGVSGKRTTGWPTGWESKNRRASELIGAAIDVAREAIPQQALFRRLKQGYESKTPWCIHFIESGEFDAVIRAHPLGKRLVEISSR